MKPQLTGQQVQPAVPHVLALVIVWSPHEPHRVGETALLPSEQPVWMLGRNPTCQREGMPLQMRGRAVIFFRQRPPGSLNQSEPTERGAMLAGAAISRRQIEIQVQDDTLRVKNIGRCGLRVNGVPVTEAIVRPRDTLYLEDQLMLYCTWRPMTMAPLFLYPTDRASHFGEPDQDGIVGESPAIWQLRENLAVATATQQPVVLRGPCSTGKDQAAHAMQRMALEGMCGPSAGNSRPAQRPGGVAVHQHPSERQVSGMPKGRIEIAATEPGFHEVRVPGLDERPEDLPFILNHILRQQAQADTDDADLSHYFRMGLPRLHPLLIEQLLHHSFSRHLLEIRDLAAQALAGRQQGIIGPLLAKDRNQGRRKPAIDDDAQGATSTLPVRSIKSDAPLVRSKGEKRPPQGETESFCLSAAELALTPDTLAMLLREGMTIPQERIQRSSNRAKHHPISRQ